MTPSESPRRIRLSRARGWTKPPNTVVVSRPTIFGNPFGPPDGETATRQCLVDQFTAWLRFPACRYRLAGIPGGFSAATASKAARDRLVAALPGVAGKHLACWCHADQPCHADVLLDVAAGRLRVEPLRILVTGSRDWVDAPAVESVLRDVLREFGVHPAQVTVVHGAARGVDTIAHQAALRLGMRLEPHPADWERHGKAAGHRRNAHMVSLGADVVVAFPRGRSRGTRGCMALAVGAGIPVRNLGDPEDPLQPTLFEVG